MEVDSPHGEICVVRPRGRYRPVTAVSPPRNRLPRLWLHWKSTERPPKAGRPSHRRQSWDSRSPRSTRQSFFARTSTWSGRCWILAVAALVASSAAVLILANDEDHVNSAAVRASPHPAAQQQLPAGTRFDGGPDEGTRGLRGAAEEPGYGTRFDGGPEEGTRGARFVLRVAQPAGPATSRLPADSGQGSLRWPDRDPAGSWRSLDPSRRDATGSRGTGPPSLRRARPQFPHAV